MKQLLLLTVCICFCTQLYANTPLGTQGLTWKLENGVLTISKTGNGTGEMPSYNFGNQAPWHNQKDKISKLILEEGVTSVGNYAFEKHTVLTSVVFAESIKRIDAYAFYCCPELTAITLPKKLESIGYRSFYYCTGLTSVTIPANVTIIRHEDFAGCKNLKEVYTKATTPPMCKQNVFRDIPANCKLYVPGGNRIAYETADTWKDFNPILADETSLSEITISDIQIYPNPVKEGFSISGIGYEAKLTISNMNGITILSQTINDNDYIPVSSLPTGLYIVKIEITEGSIIKKLIKQ